MDNEPVLTITALFALIEAAVVAVIGVFAAGMTWSPEFTTAVVAAASAITIAIGAALTVFFARPKVTPIANPNLPIDTVVNKDISAPTGVVTLQPAQP